MAEQDANRALKWWEALLLAVGIGIVIIVITLIFLDFLSNTTQDAGAEWLGLGEFVKYPDPDSRPKTAWDWLSILFVPLILLGGGYFLNTTIQRNATRAERQQQELAETSEKRFRELELARQREQRALELDIEEDRVREVALQDYLDRISNLVIDQYRDVIESYENENAGPLTKFISYSVDAVVRSRTTVILRRLDASRRSIVIEFLREMRIDILIRSFKYLDLSNTTFPIDFDLSSIDLDGVNLASAFLQGAIFSKDADSPNFSQAYLQYAKFENVSYLFPKFFKAHLVDADFQRATLYAADFREAVLWGANFQDTNLTSAALRGAQFSDGTDGVDFGGDAKFDENTILPDGTHYNPELGIEQLKRFTHPPENDDTPQPEESPD